MKKVFHLISGYFKVGLKHSTVPRFLNPLLGAWIWAGTLLFLFDVQLKYLTVPDKVGGDMTYLHMLPFVVAKIDTSRRLLELQYMFKPLKRLSCFANDKSKQQNHMWYLNCAPRMDILMKTTQGTQRRYNVPGLEKPLMFVR